MSRSAEHSRPRPRTRSAFACALPERSAWAMLCGGLILAGVLMIWTQAYATPSLVPARMLPAAVDPVEESAWVAAMWEGIGTWRSGPELLRSPDRDVILSLIRDHRRGASETWRTVLADAIYHESMNAAVDPLLIASIVASESSFKSRIVSHRGAVGLMQLRPWVARDVARRYRMSWSGTDTLHSPSLNVRLGIRYYKELVQRFDGDAHAALTAYNYGPTRVRSQQQHGTYAGSSYARAIIERYSQLQRDRAES